MKISMQALAELIKTNCRPHILEVKVEGTWKDWGAGEWWDTIIITYRAKDGSLSTYQALCPRDHHILNSFGMTVEEAQKFIDEVNKRGL